MGRPKKSEAGAIPTAERIFQQALLLFAAKGFDAVSVRDITGSLGLNEATLYVHYKNKAALLEAIFERFEQRLLTPGFQLPPPDAFGGQEGVDLASFLIEGAKHFFARADRETRLTWRILMISQYSHEQARRSVESHVLAAPVRFFSGLLEGLQNAGRIRKEIDCQRAARIIAALFFDYSFRANLKAAWGEPGDADFDVLAEDLRYVTKRL